MIVCDSDADPVLSQLSCDSSLSPSVPQDLGLLTVLQMIWTSRSLCSRPWSATVTPCPGPHCTSTWTR